MGLSAGSLAAVAGCENVLGLDDARARAEASTAPITEQDSAANRIIEAGLDAGAGADDADANTPPLPDLANDAGPPLKVASLGEHTCAVGRDHRAYCWGNNTDGQLGDGTKETRDAPVLVHGAFNDDVVDVSAGYTHSCFVRGNGDLYCWGKNDRGQLGDGTKDDRTEPTVLSMSGIVKVGAAGWHTCALTKLDTVRCWGDNYYGALGTGSFLPERSPSYIEVKGLEHVTQLAVGVMHNCAATAQRNVYCWGRAVFGEVGYPVDPDAGSPDPNDFGSAIATRVPNLEDVHEVVAGEDHTCVGTFNGEVYCWGRDDYAQLGDGVKGGIKVSPTKVQGNLTYAFRLAAGAFTTCATFTGGTVRCWGENNFGQLGNGNTTEGPNVPSPPIVSLSGIEQLATNRHTCAWQRKGDDRRLFCWGRNNLGQLGLGHKSDYELTPQEVIFPTSVQTSP